MTRKYIPFALLFSALFVFASCLKDEDEQITYYEDTAITSFRVGTLKQRIDTVTAAGKDTSYTTTVDCSGYKFYIDHTNRQIYNADSLPYGINAAKVVCTIASKNSGSIVYKSLTSDSLALYRSADSINFEQPREFRAYSNSGANFRAYTVKVNVHRQKGHLFVWSPVTTDARLGALEAMQAVAAGGSLYVFGLRGGTTHVYKRATTAGAGWQETATSVALDANAYKSAIVRGNTLYTYSGGKVLRSADGTSWTAVAQPSLRQLTGATQDRLYALSADNRIMSSADGTSWQADAMEGSAAQLPTGNVRLLALPLSTNDGSQLVLTGTTATDARVWGKIQEADGSQPWTYYATGTENKLALPNLANLQTAVYGGRLLAIGGNGMGHTTAEAFAQFYESNDGGITWKKGSIALPPSFASSATSFAMTVDADQFLWLVCGQSGQVWRGRLNRLGWQNPQKVFTE
ncbi:DUF6242 domain-containing protein [Prevotella sp. kh1p2]|uniref:DUF6242 domain-containing protein n=1 Tax=Prevotella sp. kh1p2 TaxID=1761883 RepID=UPI0008ADE60F|nr:DUF6242 domain-containing protein [Prevotella sp. kh1p2]SES85856.1 hypothetical protein SAMN04487825_10633 [Prevotella sp. kh1p2]SNU11063.1 hypothetical protein SAMN06298210_10733 [Prevotellaceae bacterium KH2P17]